MVEHKNENLKETVLVSRKLKTNNIQKFYLHLSMASVRLCPLKWPFGSIVSKKHTLLIIYLYSFIYRYSKRMAVLATNQRRSSLDISVSSAICGRQSEVPYDHQERSHKCRKRYTGISF